MGSFIDLSFFYTELFVFAQLKNFGQMVLKKSWDLVKMCLILYCYLCIFTPWKRFSENFFYSLHRSFSLVSELNIIILFYHSNLFLSNSLQRENKGTYFIDLVWSLFLNIYLEKIFFKDCRSMENLITLKYLDVEL